MPVLVRSAPASPESVKSSSNLNQRSGFAVIPHELDEELDSEEEEEELDSDEELLLDDSELDEDELDEDSEEELDEDSELLLELLANSSSSVLVQISSAVDFHTSSGTGVNYTSSKSI